MSGPSMPLRLSVDAEPLRKWTTQELVKAASLAGVPSNTIRRALTRGSLTTILADRIACGLGSHVDLIWPDSNRHGHNFVAAFERYFNDYRWVRDPVVKARLVVEAEALERLVTENAETIREYIAGHAETVDISELRRKKTAEPRVARGRGL